LVRHDKDKDGFLNYNEFENLLLELPVSIKTGILDEILIGEMLDVGKRFSKISFDILKFYIGGSAASSGGLQDTALDLQPGREKKSNDQRRGKLSEAQYELCREAARKITSANLPLLEMLSARDQDKEGFVSNEDVV
jgi:hypothetical protein